MPEDTPTVAPQTVYEVGQVLKQTRDFVEEYAKPEIRSISIAGTSATGLLDKDGFTPLDPADFDAFRDNPRFRAGTANMLDLDSFIAHVNRFGDADTAVFANNDREHPKLTAVLDYHRADAEGVVGQARFGRHRTTYALPRSDEWQAWTKMNGQMMKMASFAHFLDDHIIDVLMPNLVAMGEEEQGYLDALGDRGIIADPARLMDLARGLQVHERSVLREATNLNDGTGALEFASENVDANGQKLIVPGLFVIGIPVFRNGEKQQILARLRYRKTPDGVVFWYELWRLDRVFDAAFNGAVERVQIETDAPVFLGTDEGDCSPR